MIYPNALQQGDTVMIIAPSGPPTIENVLKGVKVLQEMGLSVVIGKSVYEKYGYLAGRDQVRLDDIHEAFSNHEVKAVFLCTGGYGSARLLPPHIQYEIIRQNPKIFWGYSDITALHTAFSRYAKLITFHGPMVEELGKGVDSLSLSSFNQLFHPYSTILSASECIVPNSSRTVTGQLVGGNLAVLTSIIGSSYEINTANKLLLLEDIGEEPYRVDRMLNQLLLSGKFHECSGVIFTSCHDCTPSKPSQSLQTILYEYFHFICYTCPIRFTD